MDASVSFERSWDEYAVGFGDVDGNFWLGLDTIHDLTTACTMKLRIDVVPFNLPAVSIPYPHFHVGDAASQYLLNINDNDNDITSDNTRDDSLYISFTYISGSKFSTYDRDNDGSSFNCSLHFRAGWWCHYRTPLNLNGVYGGDSVLNNYNMFMYYLSDNYLEPIRTVTMKIKSID